MNVNFFSCVCNFVKFLILNFQKSKNVFRIRFNYLYNFDVLSVRYNHVLQTVKSGFQRVFPWKVWISAPFFPEIYIFLSI